MRSNRIPMTIQVAICCAGRSVVLASDTKVRSSEHTFTTREPISTMVNRPKISFSQRHGIAVAMAGDGPVGTDTAVELAAYLSALESIPNNLGPLLTKWGNDYFRRYHLEEKTSWRSPLCSLLVINPNTNYCQLWKLWINLESADECSESFLVNGHSDNPAIFWLEYMKAGKKPPIEEASGIAIATIGIAAELNPYGIGGLELHEYWEGVWHHWSNEDIDHTEKFLAVAQDQIKKAVIGLGNRPVTPTQA